MSEAPKYIYILHDADFSFVTKRRNESDVKYIHHAEHEALKSDIEDAVLMCANQATTIREQWQEIESLQKEIESLKADAARYRWLRNGDNDELIMREYTGALVGWYLPRLAILDEAIDAAIQQGAAE